MTTIVLFGALLSAFALSAAASGDVRLPTPVLKRAPVAPRIPADLDQPEKLLLESVVTADFNQDGTPDRACLVRKGTYQPQRVLIFFATRRFFGLLPDVLRLAFDEPLVACPSCGGARTLTVRLTGQKGILRVTQESGSRMINLLKTVVAYTGEDFEVSSELVSVDMTDPKRTSTSQMSVLTYPIPRFRDPVQESARVRGFADAILRHVAGKEPLFDVTIPAP